MAFDSQKTGAPDFSLELEAGAPHRVIAGVDEAGRGPWAGPVVAAAVVLDPSDMPEGLNDSKKLSEKKREALFGQILSRAQVSVACVDVGIIDQDNILQATFTAMTTALEGLPTPPDLALIDGNKAPAVSFPTRCIIGGDGKSLSIAAASIIAKVARDRLMRELAAAHPEYDWERNKGYGTKSHQNALLRFGVTKHHRRSFAPIRKMLSPR